MIIAGGYPLSFVVPGASAGDVDVFTDRDPSELLAEEGYHPERISPKVARDAEANVEAVRLVAPARRSLVETVLASFDFGILQLGIDPVTDTWYATETWLDHARRGVIEFDPDEDLTRNPIRTQNRAQKLIRKLGWQLGPDAEAFIQRRAREGFHRGMPDPQKATVFQIREQPRTVYSFADETELVQYVQPTLGPAHVMQVVQQEG